jgi:tetratricopeptide (TPR) repeat protein
MTHLNLGNLLRDLGQWKEAETAYRAALAIKEKVTADFPAVPAYRQDLARTHSNLGVLLHFLDKPKEAEKAFRAALALQEKLTADFPAVPVYQVEWTGTCLNLGNLIRIDGKPAESLPWYGQAIAALTPLLDKEPGLAMARLFLRNSHWGRARALGALDRHGDALPDWDKTVELSAPIERNALQASRALARVRAGKVDDAVAEVVELTKLKGWTAVQLYNFASIYSLASAKDKAKQDEYAQRAVALLRQAVQAGYKDVAHLKRDADLDPLRQRDDFKMLLAELEKSKEPAPSARPYLTGATRSGTVFVSFVRCCTRKARSVEWVQRANSQVITGHTV